MRREGSPWRGVGAVFLKELSDHLTGARMFVLEWLIVLTAAAAVYVSIQQIKNTSAEDPFLFLRLFTQAGEQVPLSFATLLSFLVPLVAIGLGFDLVNSEHSRRTLSRVLSQPIYRDALLFGKFFAPWRPSASVWWRCGCSSSGSASSRSACRRAGRRSRAPSSCWW